MSVRPFRIAVAAAALLLGSQALAQAARPTPSPWDRARNPNTRQPVPGQTAPAPAAQPGQQTSAATAGAQMPEEYKRKLDALHERNLGRIEVAQVAQQQAQNPALKDLAKKVVDDHTRIDRELQAITQARGGYAPAQPGASEAAARSASLAQLRGAQGADFDRQFTLAMIRDYSQDEQTLKDMRGAMPGKDAQFKKWLDDTENVMEGRLNDFRNVKKTLDSQPRQARTPAKK